MNKYLTELILGVIFILLLFVIFESITNTEEIEKILNVAMVENYVNDNNLNLPFPESLQIQNNNEYTIKLMNKSIYDFQIELIKNYKYSKLYDCKYWTYVWANYWKFNKDEYDLNIIRTKNHIFAVLSNEYIYCVADQTNLYCVEY